MIYVRHEMPAILCRHSTMDVTFHSINSLSGQPQAEAICMWGAVMAYDRRIQAVAAKSKQVGFRHDRPNAIRCIAV